MTVQQQLDAAWERVRADEPRLAQLIAEAAQVVDPGGPCFCQAPLMKVRDGRTPGKACASKTVALQAR